MDLEQQLTKVTIEQDGTKTKQLQAKWETTNKQQQEVINQLQQELE